MDFIPLMETTSDAELVAASLTGNRDAFGQIVDRYKNLVASLVYAGTGHLATSEDLAQDTFVTAWSRLGALRDPAKLRPWLCGIARHRLQKHWERRRRKPTERGLDVEPAADLPAPEASPADAAVTREEEAMLWRALGRLPPPYREPLVLFYREQRSLADIAAALEITEEAAKQRLSRGRKLLEQEVQTFVEHTLRRSGPGSAFSRAVLAAIPAGAMPAAVGGVGFGTSSSAAAKSSVLAAWLLPFAGVLAVACAQCLLALQGGMDRRARVKLVARIALVWAGVLAVIVSGQQAIRLSAGRFGWEPHTLFIALTLFWTAFLGLFLTFALRTLRRALQAYLATAAQTLAQPIRTLPLALISLGLHVGVFLWVILLAARAGDAGAAWFVASAALTLAGAAVFTLRRQSLHAVMLGLGRRMAAACCVTLLVINLRIERWLAHIEATSITAIHDRYPTILIPVCSLALIGWWVALLVRRSPARARSI